MTRLEIPFLLLLLLLLVDVALASDPKLGSTKDDKPSWYETSTGKVGLITATIGWYTTFSEQIIGSIGHRFVSWLFGYQRPFSIKQQADRSGLFKELFELGEKLSGYTNPPRLLLHRMAELEKFLGSEHSPWWTKSKWINRWERLCAACRDFKSWPSHKATVARLRESLGALWRGHGGIGTENSAAGGPEGSSSTEIESSSTRPYPRDLETGLSQLSTPQTNSRDASAHFGPPNSMLRPRPAGQRGVRTLRVAIPQDDIDGNGNTDRTLAAFLEKDLP